MKTITTFSDVHANCNPHYALKKISEMNTKADIAVVAGDLCNLWKLEKYLPIICDKFKNVVFVAGNHEYHKSSLKKLNNKMQKICDNISNLHWLNNNREIVDGVPFIGGTLWFADTQAARKVLIETNDYKQIKKLLDFVFCEHYKTKEFLRRFTMPGDIVVTHHAPSYQSIGDRYIGSKYNLTFANRLEEFIKLAMPLYWVHGHTHNECNYLIGRTRVICNPIGYKKENLNTNSILLKA